MKKTLNLMFLVLLFVIVFGFQQAVLAAIAVPSPQNLQATITGSGNSAEVHLQWNDDPGLNYLVIKKFPDGRQMQFTIQSAIADPKCIMRGGTFLDPLVEKGETYVYSVKAYDSLLNYSAPSSISVTINIGESLGCLGKRKISLNAAGNNLAVNVSFDNPDSRKYQIFVDGKLRKETADASATIWPVFGQTHTIRVAEAGNPGSVSPVIAESAQACVKEPANESIAIKQNFPGTFGMALKLFNR